MLPLKLVRSLVLGETITHPSLCPTHHPHDNDKGDDDAADDKNHHGHDAGDETDDEDDGNHHPRRRRRPRTRKTGRRRRTATTARAKTPLLLFTPTRELIQDTYRLAAIARDIGMDLYPNSSLSHIIFSWPSPSQSTSRSPHGNFLSTSSTYSAASTSTPSSSSYRPSFSSSTTSTSSTPPTLSLCSLPNEAVPLPFPSLALASLSLLRYFVSLSKGLFKLVFVDCDLQPEKTEIDDRFSTWDCSSLSLVSRVTGYRVETMDEFSRVLAGHGWTLFKTANKGLSGSGDPEFYGSKPAYLFRRVDSNRVKAREGNGGDNCRVRELRLPPLDFKNVPLRILQYIILMTDDVFILA